MIGFPTTVIYKKLVSAILRDNRYYICRQMIKLTIKQNRTGPIAGFHPWVFSQALVNIPDGIPSGEPVHLKNEKGEFLAAGYFSSYSHDLYSRLTGGKCGIIMLRLRK